MRKHAFEGVGKVVGGGVDAPSHTHTHTQCYASTPGYARDVQIRLNAQM